MTQIRNIYLDGITAIIKCDNGDHNDIRGTWIHEYLFGNLCGYMSARHALLASKLLLKWNDKKNAKKEKKLRKQLKKKNKAIVEKEDVIKQKNQEIGQKNREIDDLLAICRDNNIRLRRIEGEIREIRGDIKTIIPDRAQKVQYSPNKEQIIILKCSVSQCIDEYLQAFDPSLFDQEGLKDIEFVLWLIYNDKPEPKLGYAIKRMSFFDNGYYFRVIRGQKKYIKKTITAMEKDGLSVQIFYAFNDASSVPRWRENVDQGVISVKSLNNKYTWFKLDGIDENEFKQQLKDVEKHKYNVSDSNYEYLF